MQILPGGAKDSKRTAVAPRKSAIAAIFTEETLRENHVMRRPSQTSRNNFDAA
jgi:hypothetical protein